MADDVTPPANTEQVETEPVLKPDAVNSDTAPTPEPNTPKDEGTPPILNPDDPEAEKEQEPTGAPETYEAFTLPEGFELSEEETESTKAFFKETNLTQKQAQRLIDEFCRRQQIQSEKMMRDSARQREEWKSQTRATPTFALDSPLANRGVREVCKDPEIKQFLTESWVGDHPAFFKIMKIIGSHLAEDNPGKSSAKAIEKSDNEIRFPVNLKQ